MNILRILVTIIDIIYIVLILDFVGSEKDKATKIGFSFTALLFLINIFLMNDLR